MILMQAHARTERVAVAGLEKMLHKVRWALGEVSLYEQINGGAMFRAIKALKGNLDSEEQAEMLAHGSRGDRE